MKRRVGVCPTCGNQVGVTARGIVVSHRGNFNSGRAGCPGSGKPEREAEATEVVEGIPTHDLDYDANLGRVSYP